MHKTSFSIHNYILTNKCKQAPQSPGIEPLSAVCVCVSGVFETVCFVIIILCVIRKSVRFSDFTTGKVVKKCPIKGVTFIINNY